MDRIDYDDLVIVCKAKSLEIERLKKEKEEFRLDNCKVNEERAHTQGRNMVFKEEIKQLKKEKEWLLNKYSKEVESEYATNDSQTVDYFKEEIIEEMQQALK